MPRINVLSVEWRSHHRKPELAIAELLLDGRPLLEQCQGATGETFDLVSPFGWTPPAHQQAVAQRLLLRQPALLPTGRRELLVCPICADLGCGCISAAVRLEDGRYVWSDLGYENDYDPEASSIFPMGSFTMPEEMVNSIICNLVPGID